MQDYQEQLVKNEEMYRNVTRLIRPDLYSIMERLDNSRVNYIVLLKFIDHLEKIGSGTRFGTVTAEIQDNIVTFIRSLESSRLNEPILAEIAKSL